VAVRFSGRGAVAIAVASVVGLAALCWPLFVHASASADQAHTGDAPWVMAVIIPLLLVALLGEVTTGGIDAKGVALLGVLGAVGAALRIPSAGTAGFEPTFFLLFPAGYVLGRQFGFLLGALTLFASALVTGGVGPWLPFQMMAAAWMGYGAGLLPRRRGRAELPMLAAYAAVACLLYGTLTDMWFWPFWSGSTTAFSVQPGASLVHNLGRFVAFDLTTSLGFDIPRAALNAVLILTVGRPVVSALRRASHRAAFGAAVVVPPGAPAGPAPEIDRPAVPEREGSAGGSAVEDAVHGTEELRRGDRLVQIHDDLDPEPLPLLVAQREGRVDHDGR
jgi:energy-coupling factor transport system substrate-specific component